MRTLYTKVIRDYLVHSKDYSFVVQLLKERPDAHMSYTLVPRSTRGGCYCVDLELKILVDYIEVRTTVREVLEWAKSHYSYHDWIALLEQ